MQLGGWQAKNEAQPNLQAWQHTAVKFGQDRYFGSQTILTVQESEVIAFGFENGTSKGRTWRQLFHGSPNSTGAILGVLLQQLHQFGHEVWPHDDLAHAWIETLFCGL